MVDNHAYFQTDADQSKTVLKNEANKPSKWMHKPTPAEVDQFKDVVLELEPVAKKVRKRLIDQWVKEEVNNTGDIVRKLHRLRTSSTEENIWPCNCGSLGWWQASMSVFKE